MPKTYTIKPRFWIFLMTTFLIVFVALYAVLDKRSDEMRVTEAQLLAKHDELSYRVYELSTELDYVRSKRGIEQLARANGMIMPGETQFVAVEGN